MLTRDVGDADRAHEMPIGREHVDTGHGVAGQADIGVRTGNSADDVGMQTEVQTRA